MPGIRLLDQKPQYTLASSALAAGGSIHFFESGTSTPKDVYGEPALSTNLGSVITLDSDGRHSEDIHLNDDAAYRIDVRDSDGASIPGYPLDDVGGGAGSAGADIPVPEDGEDGDVWRTTGLPNGGYWGPVRELADGTGHDGEVWYSDGTESGGYYAPLPTPDELPDLPADGVTQPSTGVVTIGGEQIVRGSGSAATNGTITVTASVTFPAAFASAPNVVVTPTIGGVTGDSPSGHVSAQATNISTTGFTAEFFAGAENNGGNANITSAVTFNYMAMGPAA